MPVPEGYYLRSDGLLGRKCDGTCDTCPEFCWTGRPVEYFDGEEPDEFDDEWDIPDPDVD